jgi:hypothetical protein
MKYFLQGEIMIKKSALVVILMLIFLTACNQSGVNETMPAAANLPGYPVGGQATDSAYPAPVSSAGQGLDLTGFITDTPDPVKSPIIISTVEKYDGYETILITNITNSAIDIGGYMLYSPVYSEKFTVPTPTVLEPGMSFKVSNGDSTKAPDNVFWMAVTLLNDVQDEVWLVNKGAAISYYFIYYPSDK